MPTETTAAAHAASSGASAAAGAAAAAPLLAGFGIDLTTIGAAFVGVVVVQTLMPATRADWRVLAGLSIGSMLFSSLGTPLAELWAEKNVAYFSELRDWHAHALVAATLGGFAQPLLLGVKALLGRWLPGAAPAANAPAGASVGAPPVVPPGSPPANEGERP